MRIAQIVLPGASQYERKSQRADFAALAAKHEVIVTTHDALPDVDVAHVYTSGELPAAPFVRFPVPYVASAPLPASRWRLRRPVPPSRVLSPLGEPPLPEVVEEHYWNVRHEPGERTPKVVASLVRPGTQNFLEQTLSRIHRFRDDVEWHTFEDAPAPEDLAGVDAWIDPAIEENDYDGFVAEALVVGLPVVATRTPINALRLEQGRTGMLVPPRDPNEMTHAILTTLFKREIAESKRQSAQQTVSKFRARHRLRLLTELYESLTE